jgi:hypothetical protein
MQISRREFTAALTGAAGAVAWMPRGSSPRPDPDPAIFPAGAPGDRGIAPATQTILSAASASRKRSASCRRGSARSSRARHDDELLHRRELVAIERTFAVVIPARASWRGAPGRKRRAHASHPRRQNRRSRVRRTKVRPFRVRRILAGPDSRRLRSPSGAGAVLPPGRLRRKRRDRDRGQCRSPRMSRAIKDRGARADAARDDITIAPSSAQPL